MKNLLLLFIVICISFSCKEKPKVEEQTKFCWTILDVNFNFLKTVCDKTASEIALEYDAIFYYRNDEPKKCWFDAATNTYAADVPESWLKKRYPTGNFVVVVCGYCAQWFYSEKRKYIPNNSITYSFISSRRLCGDTVTTLFRGREVFLRQSTDSLIVRQFSDNGSDW
jgi:hypothetical protein